MRRSTAYGAGATALAATCAVVYALSGSAPTTGGGTEFPAAANATVTAARHDIASILNLDAGVVAHPTLQAVSPVVGTIESTARKGAVLSAGAAVAVVRDSSGRRHEITTPVAATVTALPAAAGSSVPKHLPVVTLQAAGFGLQGEISDAALYRFQDIPAQAAQTSRAQIDNGPGPFGCPLLGGPAPVEGKIELLCGAPDSVQLFPGLKGLLAVTTAERKQVVSLPLSAVAGAAQHGRVSLRGENSAFTERDVELGITNGTLIEVTKGLEPGDVVSANPPSLPSRPEG
ncbi:hypothetical protein [Streptomyces sp. NBC_00091]|uniref:hypothetical protein n=1 Tax=Streptomyces sp. NBC_00091 TaxID=2975648 RepID=UPI00225A3B68|nr:hypothetical protein [Streptomyces sp. NBC_00091]MCX5380339.1 hypothetical protein [Streptomyces sp. NBC_00091]